MNKITLRGSGILESSGLWKSPVSVWRRNYPKDGKEKEDGEANMENVHARKGVLHDKQQSIQEESYFHKEEIEQLKGLKKKMTQDKEEKKEDKKN